MKKIVKYIVLMLPTVAFLAHEAIASMDDLTPDEGEELDLRAKDSVKKISEKERPRGYVNDTEREELRKERELRRRHRLEHDDGNDYERPVRSGRPENSEDPEDRANHEKMLEERELRRRERPVRSARPENSEDRAMHEKMLEERMKMEERRKELEERPVRSVRHDAEYLAKHEKMLEERMVKIEERRKEMEERRKGQERGLHPDPRRLDHDKMMMERREARERIEKRRKEVEKRDEL